MKTQLRYGPVLFGILFLIVQLQPAECLGEKLPVIASIFPVADMVRQIGGENVAVTLLLPAGASPHTFEPKPSLAKQISTARIFFMVGAGLEFWADKLIESSGGLTVRVVLSRGIPLIHATYDHKKHNADTVDRPAHESESANPHIWLDPVIAKSMADKIVAALCAVDPAHASDYTREGDRYQDKLENLHQLIKATVGAFRIKKYISFHASWDYFARRYGLDPVGIIEASPGKSPTPRQIEHIVRQVRNSGVRAIFAEPQLNPKAAEVIAREGNVRVLLLDPIGGSGIKERNTYLDLMRYNLNVLKRAME